MNSAFLKINLKDIGKGLVVAVLTAVFTYLADVLNMPGFSITALDAGEILNIAMTAGLAYLAKNLFSDTQGKFLGRIG